ncbi:hypothetical protein L2Y96_17910 [Luteibacter aegosomaticola]|uniref:hypothetical protein n=1 Tax=Luteibacter aegosomaticola TaxID=2911538 RepID=UPI001FFAF2E5|nr:hypothetical protein [Luteibacter aegosomaticola]UPG89254.1 hypothetical protein L2Y96_17910 [Luteibacter aegosomaticola]
MSYAQLHAVAQKQAIPVSLKILFDTVTRITGAEVQVRAVPTVSGSSRVRGAYLKPGDNSWLAGQFGGHPCILIASGQSDPAKRFAQVKELMHVFDDAYDHVGTADDFEVLLEQLTTPPAFDKIAPGVMSEHLAVYMALGLLCPEAKRQEFARELNNGKIKVEEIADALQIPVSVVHILFGEHTSAIILHCVRHYC